MQPPDGRLGRHGTIGLLAALCLLVCGVSTSCSWVADSSGFPVCGNGSYECGDDDRVDWCHHGQWEAFEDCQASCDGLGFCDYDSFDLAVCVCE